MSMNRISVSIILSLVLLLHSCGLKMPPIPPEKVLPPVVQDLKGEIINNQVVLSWTLEKKNDAVRVDGFIVYRAQISLSDSNCEGCPEIFIQQADLEVLPDNEQVITMQFKDSPEKGFNYIYKVNTYTGREISPVDSNLVKLEL